MKCLLILSLVFFGGGQTEWKVKKEKGFSLYYQSVDAADKKIYTRFYKTGIRQVRSFFGQDYKTNFSVYVHPSRSSLDSTWRVDWKAPDFRSECWMVASGISGRVDMLSPRQWSSSACEHDDKDKKKRRRSSPMNWFMFSMDNTMPAGIFRRWKEWTGLWQVLPLTHQDRSAKKN